MALTTEEQELYDFAKASLPEWMPDNDEFLMGAAKMFGSVKTFITYLFAQTLISTAVGPTATTPDWLNLHASDRGTRRQDGEDDITLRERLRTVPDALTRESILAATNAILLANGLPETAAMVELGRDAAHLGTFTSDAGTGGSFAFVPASITDQVFTPTVPFARVPYRSPTVVRRIQGYQLVLDNTTEAWNGGTFPITGISVNGARYVDPSSIPGADPVVDWTAEKLDRRGNVLDGKARAFCGRGFRVAGSRPAIVIMLPYGTTTGIVASVREMLRQKKAAGVRAIVERRLNP